MAGAGFKTFNTGDVLTASDVNTYLMQQTVMVFDDAAARTSALGANVAEGMMSYLKDTNKTYRYDGSAWLDDAGATSPLTTKGDIWGYSTTDARIPVGANGTVLTADSAETLGVKWATPAGGGKVLQVVNATYSTQTANSTNTYADTGLTASITPSSATNKVLVLVNHTCCMKSSGNAGNDLYLKLVRGVTDIFFTTGLYTGTTLENTGCITFMELDSPATTSSVTYKTVFANGNNTALVRVQQNGVKSTITLLEIEA